MSEKSFYFPFKEQNEANTIELKTTLKSKVNFYFIYVMRRFHHLSLFLSVALSQRNVGHLVDKQLTAYTEIQPHPGLI